MKLGWIFLLLLSFPVLEAIGIFWVADEIGGWVLLWLLADVFAGMALIRFARIAWGAQLLFSMQSGASPLTALFASGRIVLAGGLLVFPGFISDALAITLLLIPGTWTARRRDPLRPANEDLPPNASATRTPDASATPAAIIEGEFRREPDDGKR